MLAWLGLLRALEGWDTLSPALVVHPNGPAAILVTVPIPSIHKWGLWLGACLPGLYALVKGRNGGGRFAPEGNCRRYASWRW